MLKTNERDSLQRFLFENAPIRGEGVHLDASWRIILERHDYPPVVRNLLGEMMAASALLASTLKFDGSLIIQLQGDGPIPLMVMEATSDRTLRGMAEWKEDIAESDLPELVGSGTLAITIDPAHGKERYQGIVAIEGETLAESIEAYLLKSEQLDTRLWLAADENQSAGMLIQKIPSDEMDIDEDCWNRALHLADTITAEELLQLPTQELIYRLFHEEDLRLFESEPISFRCSCSRDRVSNVLRSFGYDEIFSIIQELGKVHVDCEYCNQAYEFDSVDAEQLFASTLPPDTPPTQH
jgi:molecular chaperone Hsp33